MTPIPEDTILIKVWDWNFMSPDELLAVVSLACLAGALSVVPRSVCARIQRLNKLCLFLLAFDRVTFPFQICDLATFCLGKH